MEKQVQKKLEAQFIIINNNKQGFNSSYIEKLNDIHDKLNDQNYPLTLSELVIINRFFT